MKQKTPLLRPLRQKGATLYVFPSANEDIGLNLDSRTTGAALSHYALLNMPAFSLDDSGKDGCYELAIDLQNYVMNFETLLLNQDSYNYQDYHTVSERVFWHWMHDKVGHVKFEKPDVNTGYIKEKYTKNGTVSDTESDDRVVLCFGSIDAGNSLSTEFGIFNETYINIPTSYGAGPVFFKECDPDSNFKFQSYTGSPTNLQGRDNTGLNYLNNIKPQYDSGNMYNPINAYEILKDIPEIQNAINSGKKESDKIIINSFDDINVDVNNKLNLSREFKFNAILLYYSVYDQDDTTKSPYAINLFGIIFLDGPIKSNSSNNLYYIPQFIKKKSNNGYFGNSYSFRVNMKTMSVYDNSDAVINDNTTLSSIYSLDFSDVISNLNKAIDTMNTNVHVTTNIQEAYMNILTYYDDQRETLDKLTAQVNGLLHGSNTNILDTNLLLTNGIAPHANDDTGEIKLMLNKHKDYIDFTYDAEDTGKYTSPVIIKNLYNIPAMYYPQVDASLEFSSFSGIIPESEIDLNTVIKDGFNLTWYIDADQSTTQKFKSYPIINIDHSVLQANGATHIVDSSDNINYNLLTTYLLGYAQNLSHYKLTDDDLSKIINDQTFIDNIVNNINIDEKYHELEEYIIKVEREYKGDVRDINTSINNILIRLDDLYNQILDIDVGVTEIQFNNVVLDLERLKQRVTNIERVDIPNINSSILNVHKDIDGINKKINNINSSINKLQESNELIINTKLPDIWNELNLHKQQFNTLTQSITEINNKLNDILTWKTTL